MKNKSTPTMDRKLPAAVEAEAALLGAVLHDPRQMNDISISPADFYDQRHGMVFDVMAHLYAMDGDRFDVVSIKQELDRRGNLETIGGVARLVGFGDEVPDATNAPYYAKLIRETAQERQTIEALHRATTIAYGSDTLADKLDAIEREIFAATVRHDHRHRDTLAASTASEIMGRLERGEPAASGLRTGFYEVDAIVGGMMAGDVAILAARPSIGKTAFAQGIAEHLSIAQGRPVGFISLEMTRAQLVTRILASRAEVTAQRINEGTLNPDEMGRLAAAYADLQLAQLHIDDNRDVSITALRATLRRMVGDFEIQFAIIDYLQLLSAPGSESRFQEVSQISRALKALAGELEIPILVLSQLNRASETRQDHRPMLSDLRESGQIEQDADVVALLHRPGFYDHNEDPGPTEVIIAKNRNGPTGTARLRFDPHGTRFCNW